MKNLSNKNLANILANMLGANDGLAPLYEATSVDLRVGTSVHFGATYAIDSQVRYPVSIVVRGYVSDPLDDIWQQ